MWHEKLMAACLNQVTNISVVNSPSEAERQHQEWGPNPQLSLQQNSQSWQYEWEGWDPSTHPMQPTVSGCTILSYCWSETYEGKIILKPSGMLWYLIRCLIPHKAPWSHIDSKFYRFPVSRSIDTCGRFSESNCRFDHGQPIVTTRIQSNSMSDGRSLRRDIKWIGMDTDSGHGQAGYEKLMLHHHKCITDKDSLR